MAYLQFLFFGAVGGFARGFVGAYKHSLKPGNNKKIHWGKMAINICAATAVGAVVGLIVDVNPVTACASGYAGIDIIESIIKLS